MAPVDVKPPCTPDMLIPPVQLISGLGCCFIEMFFSLPLGIQYCMYFALFGMDSCHGSFIIGLL